MLKKICFLSCHNLYASKFYFTRKLAEAFDRQGIQTRILTWPQGPVPADVIRQISLYQPNLTCSFHQLPEQPEGGYFWDSLKLPHWTILLDPVFYDLELMRSPFSIISCVDRSDCELLRSYQFNNVFFFPHAVEKELIISPETSDERPIDVLLLGTCYDPDHLREHWQKIYSKEINSVLEDAIERVLSDNKTSFFRALLQALAFQGMDPHEVDFDHLAYYVDSYSRGIDRIELVRSIKRAHVHVFGSTCWREEKPIEDWSYYLAKQANVTIHAPVAYSDSLVLMRKSKICLNSMPFFKNGSHERVFTSLACGALPLTSDNLYMREEFSDNKDLLFYQFTQLEAIDEKIHPLLSDDQIRIKLVRSGQEKVLTHHTWNSRVDSALKNLSELHL